jgi:hypothetical protein
MHAKEHEKKERNKDSPYFQIKGTYLKKREIHDSKEYQKIFRIRKVMKKIPHTCMSWSKCMICISLWSCFWLSNICDASMPTFHTYPKLHSKALVVGYEKEGKIKCLGEVSYTLSDRENHLRNLHVFYKIHKTSG